MTAKTEAADSSRVLDYVMWGVVTALIIGAVVANSWFSEEPVAFRVVGFLVVALIAAGVAYQTEKGKAFVELLKEARIETRKVVWPTKQETYQTTMIVVGVVVVASLVLWGLDSLLSLIVSSLIG